MNLNPIDASTVLTLAVIVFAAGGIFAELKSSRREHREKIEKIERKLENGISDKLEQIKVNGAARGEQLDTIQKHVDAMLKDCPIVHAIVFNKTRPPDTGDAQAQYQKF